MNDRQDIYAEILAHEVKLDRIFDLSAYMNRVEEEIRGDARALSQFENLANRSALLNSLKELQLAIDKVHAEAGNSYSVEMKKYTAAES